MTALEESSQKQRELYGGTNESVADSVRQCMQSFNSNGYKSIKVLCFGEATLPISKLGIGTVIGLLNPRVMKNQKA